MQVLGVFQAAPELTDMLEAVEDAAARFGGGATPSVSLCSLVTTTLRVIKTTSQHKHQASLAEKKSDAVTLVTENQL